MTPERWRQVEGVFERVVELPAGERPAFLDRACGSDRELRREVESLLAAHAEAGSLLDHQSLFLPVEAPEEDRVSLTAGQVLGRYEIISLLGRGGMGEVYRARDTELGRNVAVKVLPATFSADAERLRRFVQEAKAASALNHPNILTIHEIGQAGSTRFIVTEFIEGKTLREKMHRDKTDLKRLLDYLAQVADGLANAHAAGIVHRDLKPDNIMVTRDGYAKILDFGLAKLVEPPKGFVADAGAPGEASTAILRQHSTPGVVLGTVGYMSPEQAQGKSVDQRSDVFSFGCVLYEAATGRQPFAGEYVLDTLHKIIYEPSPPVREFNRLAPAGLQRIVNRCLAKDPEERYQATKDLALDLRGLRREMEGGAALGEPAAAPVSNGGAVAEGVGGSAGASARGGALSAAGQVTRASTSSAEYIVSGIRQHRRGAIAALAALALAAAAASYFYFAGANKTAINSLAVLPFVHVGGDPEMAYLSDGITESLINGLSQVPDLRMIAFGSVIRYRGRETDPQAVGRELGVQAVLTGRVVQRGDGLLISAELLNTRDGSHIWGEQYSRKLTDIVTLQQEIARAVSRKLRARLSGEDAERVAKNYTANPEAYQLYLKGRYHTLKRRLPETQKAISYFQQAIEIDPSYALAYVGLADAYRSALAGDLPPMEFLPKSKAAAQKAVEIDDALGVAHAELGFSIFWYDWDWNSAENQFKRALELDPNSPESHVYYAHLLSNTGRHEEALAEARRARELDPLNSLVNALEAQFLIHALQTDEALARLQKTFELDPNYYLAHLFASSAYIEKGMYEEAVAEARKAREVSGVGNSHPAAFLGYALAKSGREAEARSLLEGLLKSSTGRYVSPYNIALIYHGLGERDEAIAWLERGYAQRDQKMVFLKAEPKWDDLRSDPGFRDLLRRTGFTS